MVLKNLLFPIFLFVLISLVSCSTQGPQYPYIIGFSQCCDDAWRDVMNEEMARELTFHSDIQFITKSAQSSSSLQIKQIKELIDSGIHLLIVAPNESQPLTPIIEEVYQAGIPVILIDRKTESAEYSAYIGADNYEIGQTAAKYISSRFKDGGKILELQMAMKISPAAERHQGFVDEIKQYPHFSIIKSVEMNLNLSSDVRDSVKSLLSSLGPVDIIFGHTDLLAENAFSAASELELEEELFFVGVDGYPSTGGGIESVEKGVLDASLLYPTGGGEAIRLAMTILKYMPYDRINRLQTTVIDSTNASILHSQLSKVHLLQKSINQQIHRNQELQGIYQNQRLFIFFLLSSLMLAMILGGFLWYSLRAKQVINLDLQLKNREVLAQKTQIEEISEEVRKATQVKVEFFTNISHEFRTPLTLILGFAENLLPSLKFNDQTQLNIKLIRQNAVRLLRLVNQLMDFRKIESEKMIIRASEQDILEFIQNIMKSYFPTARNRDIDFQLISRHKRLPVWFDVNMLDKVLFNLLSNAFKFTPDHGKIHLYVRADKLENIVKIKVEDSGPGMRPEVLNHIFEAFYQGDGTTKMSTGLGLPLSKALVQLHQGDLIAQSIPGKGSRFSLSLPLGRHHLKDEEILPFEPVGFLNPGEYLDLEEEVLIPVKEQQQNQEYSILIIEDHSDIQFFLKQQLEHEYNIISSSHGVHGLETAIELGPDLIICDVMLPGQDGLSITKTLKSDLRTSHIPIILLTSQSTVEQQIEGTKAGADAYIPKPFNASLLKEKIKNLLHNRQILRESYGSVLMGIQPHPSYSLDQQFLHAFVLFVNQNFHREDFQVADLSKEFGLSRSQLYRKVKALLGQSISDYIQQIRLQKAEELLKEEELSISDIAYKVGYSSPEYFSTVFKTKYDISPTKYRKDWS
ncbi:MAG: substrate-binding domain-containing protein [Bacteroidota bacterium]